MLSPSTAEFVPLTTGGDHIRCSLYSTAAHFQYCGEGSGACHIPAKAPTSNTCVTQTVDLAADEQPIYTSVAQSGFLGGRFALRGGTRSSSS